MNASLKNMEKNIPKAVRLLKAMAHSDRLLILCQLVNGEKSVGELLENSTLSQSAFSQQLALLRSHELVQTRKKSTTVYYSLANDHSSRMIEILHELYCNQEG